jgi:uncharacterized protein (TIGR03437 family)
MLVCEKVRWSQAICDLLTLLILLMIAPVGWAAELSLPVQLAGPGSSLVVSIAFAPGTDTVGGLQFDLQYDSSAMSVVATAGEAARSSGKSIYYKDLSPNVRCFLVAGFNQNPIPAGPLITLFLNVNSSARNGTYALAFLNVASTDTYGSTVAMTSADGTLIVQGTTGSRIQPSGVLNAASLASGAVAPGEILTLFGSAIGPPIATQPTSSVTGTMLVGTGVLFDGNPAPLLYAAPNQINAIVPYGISGENATQMSITSGGQLIAGFSLPVVASTPALFTLDGSGSGPGAILNQDSTLNSFSNPASRGSVVVLYATGVGAMVPTPTGGQVAGNILEHPSLPVAVTIQGFDAEILYAGAAPGLVEGLVQINCRVPQSVAPGVAVPVGITVGTASSLAGVVMAIQ